MSDRRSAGRGRGESPKISRIEQEEQERRYTGIRQQAGAIPVVDVADPYSSSSEGEAEKTVRGRGGFRPQELHLIPSGVTAVRTENAQGQPVDMLTNFIRIQPMPERQLFQYRIDFEPDMESLTLRRKLFADHVQPKFTERMAMFDGMSDIRTASGDQSELNLLVDHPIKEGEKIAITVKKVGLVDSRYEQIRVYNINMKEILRKLGFFRSSNTGAYVHRDLATPIGKHNIVTVRGYRTSANVHEGGAILMNLESVHKIMQRQNVCEMIKTFMGQPNWQETANLALTGKLVVTSYDNRIYRIEKIRFDKRAESTFHDLRTQQAITFIEYYRTRKDKEIKDLTQPLLQCLPNSLKKDESTEGKEWLLVPELCNLAGLTERQRNDFYIKKDLIQASQLSPADRVQHMRTFMESLHRSSEVKQILEKWGYAYANAPVNVKGRTLPTEQIAMGRFVAAPLANWPKVNHRTADFTIKEELAKKPEFAKLVILISRRDHHLTGQIGQRLKSGFETIKCEPANVQVVDIDGGDAPSHFVQQLRRVPEGTTATLVIMPQQNKDRYDAIKKFASVERGMITQVVTSKLLMNESKARSAVVKIAVQVAAKIGGEPWYIYLPLPSIMICGYDTYHDTANRGRSFGAFVASMNDKYSRWFSKADSHDRLDELSAHMQENFVLALRKYRELNDKFPERVFIYRDGVSDGQLEHVLNSELRGLRKAIRVVDRQIKLTYIVVNKRIGARFYMKAGQTYANAPPGTIVDDVVTRKERYDFYLVSQSTGHGTVAPTYYSILHDESGLDAAKHQMMAFKMCFLYYNWTGTVRVPAPCQYAHKLALLCGEHLHAVPSSQLDDRLHFL